MSAAAKPGAVERRRSHRQRALLTGKLATNEASLTIDCVIRNLSPTGALVETGSPHLLPAELHLLQVREGVAWDAKVIWRRGNQVGLELVERHELKDSTDKQLRALRGIWSQMVGR
ncbi:MAG TPA: PilZ domain-containing protein [Caulobacter sp.]|nr:PilZ domain-containing protein [Caulobacter sp.]